MRRMVLVLLAVLLLCGSCVMHASAAEHALLSAENTRVLSGTGDFTYSSEGALGVTSSEENGVTVAIDLNLTVNVHETPFVQLSLVADCAFNIAMKLGGGEHDLFPQTASPAWYEGFQDHAPTSGGGVDAGQYTMSLSIPAYVAYNDMDIPDNGVVTLETVYIMLKSAGNITIEHLMLGENGEFQTAFGKTGQTAYSPIVITTASKRPTTTTAPPYDAGGVTRYQSTNTPFGVFALLGAAAVLTITMLIWSVRKNKQP